MKKITSNIWSNGIWNSPKEPQVSPLFHISRIVPWLHFAHFCFYTGVCITSARWPFWDKLTTSICILWSKSHSRTLLRNSYLVMCCLTLSFRIQQTISVLTCTSRIRWSHIGIIHPRRASYLWCCISHGYHCLSVTVHLTFVCTFSYRSPFLCICLEAGDFVWITLR